MLLTDAVMLFHGIFAHLHLGIVHKLRTSLQLMFVVMAEKPTKRDFLQRLICLFVLMTSSRRKEKLARDFASYLELVLMVTPPFEHTSYLLG